MTQSPLEDYLTALHPGNLWNVQPSPRGGRGIFAVQDLTPKTTLFKESPLVIGPRTDPRCPAVCIGCHSAGKLHLCPSNCGLLVCGCEESSNHRECAVLSKLDELNLREKMDLVAPLRAVFLNPREREILGALAGHHHFKHVSVLINLMHSFDTDELNLIRKCCQVLDTTAYETPTPNGGTVRAVFPAAALINHDCSPNTQHWFENQRVIFATTRHIKKGEEITTSYTSVKWSTKNRRRHLLETKHFHCECQRCMADSK